MPRVLETQLSNLTIDNPSFDSLPKTLQKILTSSLKASLKFIPSSSTLEPNSYFASDRDTEHQQVRKTGKIIRFLDSKFGNGTDLMKTACWLTGIRINHADNCAGIALDMHYRLKSQGIKTDIISISDTEKNQEHVVLKFNHNKTDYIFDPQNGYLYPQSEIQEKMKLWDAQKDCLVPFNSSKHQINSFSLKSQPLSKLESTIDTLHIKYNEYQEMKQQKYQVEPSKVFHEIASSADTSQTQKKQNTCVIL
ncbi:MAG: hypothetical protein EP298_08665 [Gammaproteobacteria bacterium]|nr:MAG: hypothetical protein EP298_08665 [Gammaproteobacteria bacterium]UTW43109.1 hypothetical protein KFE69_02900 [bacterium SCSIO 12844]